MSGTLSTIASGPFEVRRTSDAIVIVDGRGAPFATMHGDYAHHDAPILAARVNDIDGAREELEALAELQAKHDCNDVEDLAAAMSELSDRPEQDQLDEVGDKLSKVEGELTETKRELEIAEKGRDEAERRVEDLEESLAAAIAERDAAREALATAESDRMRLVREAVEIALAARPERDVKPDNAIERAARACEAVAAERGRGFEYVLASTQHETTARLCARRIRELASAEAAEVRDVP